jgi:hypothetical protein
MALRVTLNPWAQRLGIVFAVEFGTSGVRTSAINDFGGRRDKF